MKASDGEVYSPPAREPTPFSRWESCTAYRQALWGFCDRNLQDGEPDPQDAARRFAAIPHSRPGHADLAAGGTCPTDPRRAPTSREGSAMARSTAATAKTIVTSLVDDGRTANHG